MQGNGLRSHLPFSLLATAVVVVAPALVVALLPGSPSVLVGLPVCIALSLGLARAAAALWRRSPRSREVLFADLMLWGWARRVSTERRLARAQSLVADATGDADHRVQALERVSEMLESRDSYTRRHSLRVTRYSEAIARELGLGEAEVARVRKAAALHDVGKFFTPREVLNKPGRLTDEEFAIIKRHPDQGADLLRGIVEPEVEAMIRHHHERLGGGGYPDGLVGGAIPLGARIIAVADTFDAMTSTRAYRSARAHAKALTVLREEAGVALDARAVVAFEAIYSGRRSTAWSSVASGMTQTLAPLRELVLPAARALPALGASAAITAPVLAGGGVTASAADTRPAPGRGPQVAQVQSTPMSPAAARFAERLASAPGRTGRVGGDGRPVARRRGEGVTTGPTDPQAPGGTSRPGARPQRPGRTPTGTGAPGTTPAPTSTEGGGEGAGGGGGGNGGGETPEATPAPTSPDATAAPTAAPEVSSPAPTSAPEVTTPQVTVGDIEVPAIEVDLPDLPVDLPVDLPDITLPPISLP